MRTARPLLIAGLLALSAACNVGKDILEATPQEATFRWDPAEPLTAELLASPRIRIRTSGSEPYITIPDVPGLRIEIELDDESDTTFRNEDPPTPGTRIQLFNGDQFDIIVHVTECFEGSRVIEISSDTDGFLEITQTILVPVRNTFDPAEPNPDPDPDPDPDPNPVAGIASDLAIIRGINAIEDESGIAKVMLIGETAAGDGATEIRDLDSGALEHTLPTVKGRDGSAGYTPDGKLIFTAIIDDASGFVRGDVFDTATDSIYVNSDFNASQWLMGATKLPHPPARIRDWIFTAPGAVGQYDIIAMLPGPTLDGDPTVQPLIPYDLVGDARRTIRAIAVDLVNSAVLTLNRLDGEVDTVIGRRMSAPTDNPANFFESIGTTPGTPNRLLAFGDAAIAWEQGGSSGRLLARGISGDLNADNGTVTMASDLLAGQPLGFGPGGESRAAFLGPERIEELTVAPGGAPSWRTIPLAAGAEPLKFVTVTRNGLTRICILREGETELDVFDFE